jgi:hypothetical protein
MNKVVVHGFSHNPSGIGHPGIAYLAGTHFNNKRVWWPKVKPFNEYLSRVSYVLQEADFVADVLYYYGDTIPNYGGHKNSRFMVGAGFDYEIVNTEKLLELTVADKKLVLPTGAQFKILALAEESEIDAAVLSKLNELVGKGAIVTGLKPRAIKGRTSDASLIEKLWGKTEKQTLQATGGKIYGVTEPVQILQAMNVVPDFNYPGHEMRALDYIHYAKKDLDFYFIRNTTGEWISKTCSFRQPKKVPEVFDPVSGEINPVSVYNSTKNQIGLPITLAPFGSLFIVFKPGQPNARFTTIGSNPDPPQLSYSNHGILIWENGILRANEENKEVTIENHIRKQPIDGAWEVFFPEGWGAPERIIFPELVSWTKFPDKGVQYFSGTATYKKTFQYTINSTIMEGHRIFLDLGDLSNVGEVWLNNKTLGVAWAKPYRFDVTDVIRPGDNLLIVEIANVWSNRLAGDANTGEQYTNTNITATNIKGLNKISVPWRDVPLIDAGLFGPVNLITIKPVK